MPIKKKKRMSYRPMTSVFNCLKHDMLAYPAIHNVFFGEIHSLTFKSGSQTPEKAGTVVPSACKIRRRQRGQMNKKDLDNAEILGSSCTVGRKRFQWVYTFIQQYIHYIIANSCTKERKRKMYSQTKI